MGYAFILLVINASCLKKLLAVYNNLDSDIYNSMLTKVFLDTEFTGLHLRTTLISIALVADSGQEFYAEFTDYDRKQISPWIEENVLNRLQLKTEKTGVYHNHELTKVKGDRIEIASQLRMWLSQFTAIEIWADVLAYDWVLFCELFGGALNIPEHIFYSPFDLATFFRLKGFIDPVSKYERDVKRFLFAETDISQQHNSLADARAELICYKKLMNE